MPVAGFGGVLARRECSGRGYCRIAMETAEALVLNQMAVNFILLFWQAGVAEFYEHLGWAKVSNPVRVEQAQGKALLPIVSMVKCLRTERWPKGDVRLESRPW